MSDENRRRVDIQEHSMEITDIAIREVLVHCITLINNTLSPTVGKLVKGLMITTPQVQMYSLIEIITNPIFAVVLQGLAEGQITINKLVDVVRKTTSQDPSVSVQTTSKFNVIGDSMIQSLLQRMNDSLQKRGVDVENWVEADLSLMGGQSAKFRVPNRQLAVLLKVFMALRTDRARTQISEYLMGLMTDSVKELYLSGPTKIHDSIFEPASKAYELLESYEMLRAIANYTGASERDAWVTAVVAYSESIMEKRDSKFEAKLCNDLVYFGSVVPPFTNSLSYHDVESGILDGELDDVVIKQKGQTEVKLLASVSDISENLVKEIISSKMEYKVVKKKDVVVELNGETNQGNLRWEDAVEDLPFLGYEFEEDPDICCKPVPKLRENYGKVMDRTDYKISKLNLDLVREGIRSCYKRFSSGPPEEMAKQFSEFFDKEIREYSELAEELSTSKHYDVQSCRWQPCFEMLLSFLNSFERPVTRVRFNVGSRSAAFNSASLDNQIFTSVGPRMRRALNSTIDPTERALVVCSRCEWDPVPIHVAGEPLVIRYVPKDITGKALDSTRSLNVMSASINSNSDVPILIGDWLLAGSVSKDVLSRLIRLYESAKNRGYMVLNYPSVRYSEGRIITLLVKVEEVPEDLVSSCLGYRREVDASLGRINRDLGLRARTLKQALINSVQLTDPTDSVFKLISQLFAYMRGITPRLKDLLNGTKAVMSFELAARINSDRWSSRMPKKNFTRAAEVRSIHRNRDLDVAVNDHIARFRVANLNSRLMRKKEASDRDKKSRYGSRKTAWLGIDIEPSVPPPLKHEVLRKVESKVLSGGAILSQNGGVGTLGDSMATRRNEREQVYDALVKVPERVVVEKLN